MTKFTSVIRLPSTTQTVAKKHLKTHLKRIRNKEYCRLRDMVPAISKKQNISKVTVIEEAVRYIDELHRALASRLTNVEFPGTEKGEETLKDFVHSLIPVDFFQRSKPVTVDIEKQQRLPSYMSQKSINKKPARFV